MMLNYKTELQNRADVRFIALKEWVSGILPEIDFQITLLAGDASFRRYFRIKTERDHFIAMDASPLHENCQPFVLIDQILLKIDVRVPIILAKNFNLGFLLLSDFGDTQLLSVIDHQNADYFYDLAMQNLLKIQTSEAISAKFDAELYWKEFDIFFNWYLKENLKLIISTEIESTLKNLYQKLIDSAIAQPQVFVHRDYHSRNLMVCEDGALGILDFQDAVMGAITYDLVSLLKDCYIDFSREKIKHWVRLFYDYLLQQHKIQSILFDEFLKYFDLMGLQRHIKCLGIFSRLTYRDHKSGYLKEIPRVLNYIITVCDDYPEFLELKNFLLLSEKKK